MLYATCDVCGNEKIKGNPKNFENFAFRAGKDIGSPSNAILAEVSIGIEAVSQGEGKSFDHICRKCAVRNIKRIAEALKVNDG